MYYQRWLIIRPYFGGQMNFGRMVSIVIAIVAVLGVFVEIPIVSDYAFWILVAAYLVVVGVTRS